MCSMHVDHTAFSSRVAQTVGANAPASPQIHQGHLAAVSHFGNCREDVRWGDSRLNGCVVPRRRASSGRESDLRTAGEMEAAVCQGVVRVEQDFMGRGPNNLRAHLRGDLLVVRLQGVLTAAEQQLVKSLAGEKGRDLLKGVRTHLIEMARPRLEAVVEEVTGVEVLSLHHDISTVTGEEVILFTLARLPDFRETKKKS